MRNLLNSAVFVFLALSVFAVGDFSFATAEKCIDFRDFPADSSIEGPGVIYPGLNIQASGAEAVVVKYPNTPGAYAAYVGNIIDGNPILDSLKDFADDVFLSDNAERRNACLDNRGGFALKRSSKTSDNIYFNFASPISNFRIKIFDWGDFNTHNARHHSANLLAYDTNGNIVSQDSLSFSTDTDRNPRTGLLHDKPANPHTFGDACSATSTNQPGNYTFRVSGSDNIVKVVFKGKSVRGQVTQNMLSDTNVAYGVLCFTDFQPPVQLPIVDIKANNSDGPIALNDPANYTLLWTSQHAASCVGSGAWSGSKAINGSEAKSNMGSGVYTYTITCSNQHGSATDAVRVNVRQPQMPIVDIKANNSDGPINLVSPASYTLSWTSNNASSCSASGAWSGSKNVFGTESSSNVGVGNYTYTITCSNLAGSATDSVTVNVSQQVNYPTVDIKVNGTDGSISLISPASYTLSWTSNNASSCSASGAWSGSKNVFGTESSSNVGVGNYTYTITCSNQYGSANDTVTVYVSNQTFQGVLSISKLARDPAITTSSVYYENLYMIPGREVEFSIAITNSGSTQINNLYIQDTLPSGLSYISGSTTIDGVQTSDGITSSGINVGTILAGQSKTVKFRTRLNDNSFFTQSLTLITNTAYARGDNASQVQDMANVYAIKQGQVLGAATVDTGADANTLAVLVTGLGSALSLSGLQIGKRVYWKNRIAQARLDGDN